MNDTENILHTASRPGNSRAYLVVFLGILAAFGPFVTDLYLPALPDVMTHFHSSVAIAQLSLTACMVGLAAGQLIIGPLSDKFGRKTPLSVCMVIFTLSSVGIMMAPDIRWLIALRLVQGLSSAGGVVIARAAAADLYEGEEMKRFFALLMTVNGIAPIIAPVAGSLLLQLTDWRGIFICLTVLGLALTTASLAFVEPLELPRRLTGSVMRSYASFLPIVKNRTFMLLAATLTFLTAALFAYISASSFIFQKHYGFSALVYGLYFALNAAGFALGAHFSGRLSGPVAVRVGAISAVAISIALFAATVTGAGFWIVETLYFAYMICYGLVMPSASALAIDLERQNAGSASAMIGFFPFFICGVVSPLTGIGNTFVTTSAIMLACSLLAYVTYRLASARL